MHSQPIVATLTEPGPPADGQLYTVQALWEETTNSVIVGELHGSTLLDDEKSSKLNTLLAERIKGGQFNISRINIVEVNNVCDGGEELLSAKKWDVPNGYY